MISIMTEKITKRERRGTLPIKEPQVMYVDTLPCLVYSSLSS